MQHTLFFLSQKDNKKKSLFRICSIFIIVLIVFSCLAPISKANASGLDDKVDGDKTLYDVLMETSSIIDIFTKTGFLGLFGSTLADQYEIYVSVNDMPTDLYEHLRDLCISYIKSLAGGGEYTIENELEKLITNLNTYFPGLYATFQDDSTFSSELSGITVGGIELLDFLFNGRTTLEDTLGEAEDAVAFKWYELIDGTYDYSALQTPSQVMEIGARSGFKAKSGVGLSDVLIDTDGAFKALLVGAVSSSLSGAIVSVRDATVKTDNLLKEPISGESGSNEETIYNTVKSISDSVLFPIAGVILAFVFAYQIYEIVCERNNMNDIGAGTFIQLILRMAICLLLIIYAWPLTEAIFDIGRWIVEGAEPIIEQNTTNVAPYLNLLSDYAESQQGDALTFLIGFEICIDSTIDFGQMLLLLMQGLIINIGMFVVSLIIYVIVYVRLVEIWSYCAISPIPLATMSNREWGEIGRNFIRSVAALAFQAFIIMLCLTLFNVLVDGAIGGIFESADIIGSMWTVIGYSLILVFCLFKSGSISKSIMNAH